jgi:hypothetical protein
MNWTSAVELELRKFEAIVAAAAKRDGYDGSSRETDMQWSFSGALLYSVSIITTIGKSIYELHRISFLSYF